MANDQMIINPSGPFHGQEEIDSAIEACKQWWNVEGNGTYNFQKKLKEYLGVNDVELVNSGSSANLIALLSLTTSYTPEARRLNRGDEVITTALSFPTTVSPIIYAGAIPVFVDVDRYTWNINCDQVEEMITPKTKAIMVAHALGNPFNVKRLLDICRKHNLSLIEDCCDALGAKFDGKRVGQFGKASTLSFYPAHHISTGEGGAVMTSDPIMRRSMISLINWGRDCFCAPGCDNTCGIRYFQKLGDLPEGYDHKNTYTEMGFNVKMSNIQASIGSVQMDRIDVIVEKRKANYKALETLFLKYADWFEFTKAYDGAESSPFGYIVKLSSRAPFTKSEMEWALDGKGVKSRAFFCGNITKQPVLFDTDRFAYRRHDDLSVSDDIMNNSFWIGVHPSIGEKELTYMEKVIVNFLEQYK